MTAAGEAYYIGWQGLARKTAPQSSMFGRPNRLGVHSKDSQGVDLTNHVM